MLLAKVGVSISTFQKNLVFFENLFSNVSIEGLAKEVLLNSAKAGIVVLKSIKNTNKIDK